MELGVAELVPQLLPDERGHVFGLGRRHEIHLVDDHEQLPDVPADADEEPHLIRG